MFLFRRVAPPGRRPACRKKGCWLLPVGGFTIDLPLPRRRAIMDRLPDNSLFYLEASPSPSSSSIRTLAALRASRGGTSDGQIMPGTRWLIAAALPPCRSSAEPAFRRLPSSFGSRDPSHGILYKARELRQPILWDHPGSCSNLHTLTLDSLQEGEGRASARQRQKGKTERNVVKGRRRAGRGAHGTAGLARGAGLRVEELRNGGRAQHPPARAGDERQVGARRDAAEARAGAAGGGSGGGTVKGARQAARGGRYARKREPLCAPVRGAGLGAAERQRGDGAGEGHEAARAAVLDEDGVGVRHCGGRSSAPPSARRRGKRGAAAVCERGRDHARTG